MALKNKKHEQHLRSKGSNTGNNKKSIGSKAAKGESKLNFSGHFVAVAVIGEKSK